MTYASLEDRNAKMKITWEYNNCKTNPMNSPYIFSVRHEIEDLYVYCRSFKEYFTVEDDKSVTRYYSVSCSNSGTTYTYNASDLKLKTIITPPSGPFYPPFNIRVPGSLTELKNGYEPTQFTESDFDIPQCM